MTETILYETAQTKSTIGEGEIIMKRTETFAEAQAVQGDKEIIWRDPMGGYIIASQGEIEAAIETGDESLADLVEVFDGPTSPNTERWHGDIHDLQEQAWDVFVGSQTPQEFVELANENNIKDMVANYVAALPEMFGDYDEPVTIISDWDEEWMVDELLIGYLKRKVQ